MAPLEDVDHRVDGCSRLAKSVVGVAEEAVVGPHHSSRVGYVSVETGNRGPAAEVDTVDPRA